MDDAGKIALGLVGAAVVIAVAFIGYQEFDRRRNIAQVNELLSEFSKPDPFGFHAEGRKQQAARVDFDARKAAMDRQRRVLSGNQQCIGGVVILVDGASYRQLGTVGDPVRCSGQYADRPIR